MARSKRQSYEGYLDEAGYCGPGILGQFESGRDSIAGLGDILSSFSQIPNGSVDWTIWSAPGSQIVDWQCEMRSFFRLVERRALMVGSKTPVLWFRARVARQNKFQSAWNVPARPLRLSYRDLPGERLPMMVAFGARWVQ